MIYFLNLMLELVNEQEYDLFGRKQIPIPTPKFVVFYNGLEKRPTREEMHLLDTYEHKEKQYDLHLTCIVYNINPGYNKDIKEGNRVISGYTSFVERFIRQCRDCRKQISDVDFRFPVKNAIIILSLSGYYTIMKKYYHH